MRKIILFLFLFLFVKQTFAINTIGTLEKIPVNFKSECYEFYNKIDKWLVGDIFWENYKTFKIKLTDSRDIVFTQNGFILPYKYYSDVKDIYNYENNLGIKQDYLLDNNNNTFIELNSKTQNEIILNFENFLEKDNFNFVFDYSSNNYSPYFYISDNRTSWNLIKKQDIENFSFKFLKINFVSNIKDDYLENIKIYELNFR